MITQHFTDELEARKYSIVSFLSTLFLVAGGIASLIHTFLFLTGKVDLTQPSSLLNFSLTFLVTFLFIFVRFFYIKRNYKRSFIIFLILFSISSLIGAVTAGTINPVSYIIIFLMLLSTSIVVSVRASLVYISIILVIVGVIGHLQEQKVITYSTTDDFILINTIVYLLLIAIGAYVVKIGYEQIEHSYKKAFDYAKELEELNKYLDHKVKLRTSQLEESLERQAESVHSAAVMGRITKPMLHDLATPLSSLVGSYELLKKGKFDDITKEILKMSDGAVHQIQRIVENARHLMDNRDLITEFSPYDVIAVAIFVSKHELEKDNIVVDINIDPKVRINGVVAIFERIVINLIVNAIEELRQCDEKRRITISSSSNRNYFILKIKDNGRGIKKEFLDRVFDADFTSKSEHNLGFGLTFVKNTIEKKFGGEISVESEVGKFTEFTMKFDKNFNVSKRSSKKNSKKSSKRKS